MNDFHAILEPIADLLERKNQDYGDSYTNLRDEFHEAAYLIRIADKFSRVKQLMTGPANLVKEESIEDTLRDIIGYTALELRYRGQKEKPKADRSVYCCTNCGAQGTSACNTCLSGKVGGAWSKPSNWQPRLEVFE